MAKRGFGAPQAWSLDAALSYLRDGFVNCPCRIGNPANLGCRNNAGRNKFLFSVWA